MLSIPTVGGSVYIGRIFKQAKVFLSFVSMVIEVASAGAIGVAALFWAFGTAFRVLSNELETDSFVAIINSYIASALDNMVIIGYLFIFIIILRGFIVLTRKVDQLLSWLSADKLEQKERERRIGWFGVLTLMAGFTVQFIQTMLY